MPVTVTVRSMNLFSLEIVYGKMLIKTEWVTYTSQQYADIAHHLQYMGNASQRRNSSANFLSSNFQILFTVRENSSFLQTVLSIVKYFLCLTSFGLFDKIFLKLNGISIRLHMMQFHKMQSHLRFLFLSRLMTRNLWNPISYLYPLCYIVPTTTSNWFLRIYNVFIFLL